MFSKYAKLHHIFMAVHTNNSQIVFNWTIWMFLHIFTNMFCSKCASAQNVQVCPLLNCKGMKKYKSENNEVVFCFSFFWRHIAFERMWKKLHHSSGSGKDGESYKRVINMFDWYKKDILSVTNCQSFIADSALAVFPSADGLVFYAQSPYLQHEGFDCSSWHLPYG